MAYTSVTTEKFQLERYYGIWHQIGSVRPWYEPQPSSVTMTCQPAKDGTLEVQLRMRLGPCPIAAKGNIRLVKVGEFVLHFPRLILGLDLNKTFYVKYVLADSEGNYQLVVLEKFGPQTLHVLARTAIPPSALLAEIPAILSTLNYQWDRYKGN